jgi:serine/threonine protein kinase
LRDAGVNVPRVFSSFKAEENYYIAVEFIEGESLDHWLGRRRRRLAVSAALKCAAELARLVARVHAAGWVWRDCKPGNVLITKGGELRPLDFEGACPVESPDPMPWGTPAYAPPEVNDVFRGQSRLPEDLYTLGATIYLLLAGRPPDSASPLPLEKMRRNIPEDARRVVVELLDPDPHRRLDATAAARRLEVALASEANRHDQEMSLRRRASSANLGSGRRSSYIGSVVK